MLAPELSKFIADYKKANIDYSKMSAQEARKLSHEQTKKRPRINIEFPVDISTQTINLTGRKINFRIYKPKQTTTATPVIVYLHGGGFVWGLPEFWDDPCSILVMRTQATLISVDYRYAPEYPFPAAFNDAYESLVYISQHASEFNIDNNNIVMAGDSAGANLAAAVCLHARDVKGPTIHAQLLIYPSLEYNLTKKSFLEMGKDYILTHELMDWFYHHYLPNPNDVNNPLAMPLTADNFSHLPDAYIVTAKYDPLHDDGVDYAKALEQAGNKVKITCYDNMNHGFIIYGGFCPAARQAIEDIANNFARFWLGDGEDERMRG